MKSPHPSRRGMQLQVLYEVQWVPTAGWQHALRCCATSLSSSYNSHALLLVPPLKHIISCHFNPCKPAYSARLHAGMSICSAACALGHSPLISVICPAPQTNTHIKFGLRWRMECSAAEPHHATAAPSSNPHSHPAITGHTLYNVPNASSYSSYQYTSCRMLAIMQAASRPMHAHTPTGASRR